MNLSNKQSSPRSHHHQNGGIPPKASMPIFLLGALFGFAVSSLAFLMCIHDIPSSIQSPVGDQNKENRFPLFSINNTPQRIASESPNNNYNPANDDGWKDVHVFAGDPRHIVDASTIPADYYYDTNTHWFAQLRQDQIVSTLLKKKRNGYFVDLAANDAIRISNTYALERDYGWTGLCIEPNPIYWSSLSYRKCQVVGAVVGKMRMEEVVFKFGSKGPQSGIVGQGFRNKELIHNREEKRRSTVTLQEIFERFQTPRVIDYLSLDLEGAEEFVMEGFPFDLYRFNVLTIEQPSPKLQDILKQNGYQFLHNLRRDEETLWVHKEMMATIDLSALQIEIPKYSERVSRPRP